MRWVDIYFYFIFNFKILREVMMKSIETAAILIVFNIIQKYKTITLQFWKTLLYITL